MFISSLEMKKKSKLNANSKTVILKLALTSSVMTFSDVTSTVLAKRIQTHVK